jgi:hypothetical protein
MVTPSGDNDPIGGDVGDAYVGTQLVEIEPLREGCGLIGCDLNEHAVGRTVGDHVEQDLALRRQKTGRDGWLLGEAVHVVRQDALQQLQRVRASDGDDAPVIEKRDGIRWHGA